MTDSTPRASDAALLDQRFRRLASDEAINLGEEYRDYALDKGAAGD